MNVRDRDRMWPPLLEQRWVQVSTWPSGELARADEWSETYTREEVQEELALLGRQPLHLERLRGMLRQLADRMTPRKVLAETCPDCGGTLVHYGRCKPGLAPTTITKG